MLVPGTDLPRAFNNCGPKYLSMTYLSRSDPSAAPSISEENILILEDEAIGRGTRMISVLDSALVQWNAADPKQEDLKMHFWTYGYVLERINRWEREMLVGRGRSRDLLERIKMLRTYVEICYSLKVVD